MRTEIQFFERDLHGRSAAILAVIDGTLAVAHDPAHVTTGRGPAVRCWADRVTHGGRRFAYLTVDQLEAGNL